jgi:hypothetical protein
MLIFLVLYSFCHVLFFYRNRDQQPLSEQLCHMNDVAIIVNDKFIMNGIVSYTKNISN